jgi:hypothetical protein
MAASDFLISSGEERLIVEIKRGRHGSRRPIDDAIRQTVFYMDVSSINQAVLFIYNSPNGGRTSREIPSIQHRNNRLIVITVD